MGTSLYRTKRSEQEIIDHIRMHGKDYGLREIFLLWAKLHSSSAAYDFLLEEMERFVPKTLLLQTPRTNILSWLDIQSLFGPDLTKNTKKVCEVLKIISLDCVLDKDGYHRIVLLKELPQYQEEKDFQVLQGFVYIMLDKNGSGFDLDLETEVHLLTPEDEIIHRQFKQLHYKSIGTGNLRGLEAKTDTADFFVWLRNYHGGIIDTVKRLNQQFDLDK